MPIFGNFCGISRWSKQFILLISFFCMHNALHCRPFCKQPLLYNDPHYGWDWSKIDVQNISFPKNFLWGAAISEYQYSGTEGCPNSNWAHWEKELQELHPTEQHVSGKACDFWNRYKQDIRNAKKDLGINSLRFSVDWSRIEPHKGNFDDNALAEYKQLCIYLRNLGITPMITLHHFVHPQWFEELGAFEKEENIHYFVTFAKKVFEELSPYVDLWCTINEPTIYVFQGYIRTVFPPGKLNVCTALKVLKHLLQAHYEVYQALKQLPRGNQSHIGLVHQYLLFKPYNKYNPLDYIPGMLFNNILNTYVLNFCKTGKFSYRLPFVCHVDYKTPTKNILDFIGLNYYSRALIKSQFNISEPFISTHYPHEVMTDMPYAIHAEGLCTAIEDVARIGVPIYITENGIADKNDTHRRMYLERHLFVLSQALKADYDIRGYFYWSLLDNFEWDEGYTMPFGLYEVDFKTQERQLKPDSKYYAYAIERSR